MKKRIINVLVILMVLSGCLFAFLVYTARKMTGYERASAEVSQLTIFIQEFKFGSGKYPDSMSELESRADETERMAIMDIIQNKWNNRYEYRPLPDRVQIDVKGYHFICVGIVNGFEVRGDFTTNVMTATIKNEAEKPAAPPAMPGK